MSSASAFGFSAYDPVGSFFEGSINSYFDKESEKRAYLRQLQLMEQQYQYAQRYAENQPSWQVKGLRDAGLNPILAISNGVSMGGSVPSVPSASSYRSPNTAKVSFSGSGLLPFDRRISKQNADAQELMSLAADKQADAALINARSNSGLNAANTALKIIEADKLKGSRYDSNIMRDAEKVLDNIINVGSEMIDTMKTSSFLQHSPSYSPDGSAKKHANMLRLIQEEKEENQKYWKTRKKLDGKELYRKRGDVGGILPFIR